MQGVLRTWWCQNARCGVTFDSWDNYPECTKCGCARTNWMPGGGHVGSRAPGIDATLRDLADTYGMTDIASAKAGERAMPKMTPTAARDEGSKMQFAPGFVGTPYTLDAQGRAHAVCEPSAQKINFKVKASVGKALTPSGNFPSPSTNTRIEGTHKG